MVETEPAQVPEFILPNACGRSLFDQLHGGELSVDTQLGRRGRYETRVIYDFHLLELRISRTWAEAQVAHRITQMAWSSAQRWICTHCHASSWAAPGQSAHCLTPDCPGDEMCAQCTPWRACSLHPDMPVA